MRCKDIGEVKKRRSTRRRTRKGSNTADWVYGLIVKRICGID